MADVFYVEEDDTLPVMFTTYDGGTGASITLTGLAVTDIEIYKDGSITQRSSDAGYTLIDTDGIDIDSTTGLHGFTIDLSDNTDAGFYAVGSWYHVVVNAVTVDAQTVVFIPCIFRIVSATRGMSGTALPNAAADAAGGLPISDAGGLDMDQIATDTAAIVTDTNELQTDDVPGLIAALNDPTAATIADAVWDEATSGHVTAGTFGVAATDTLADTNELQSDDVPGLISALNDPTAASIADAVWDEAQSGHVGAGTFGEIATEIASILADTNELQTDDVPGLIAALNDISTADVNGEVLDVLNTDTFAEPSGVPGATVTLATKIGFLYMALRNKVTITSTKKTFFDDGDAAEWEKDLSDDGTTYTESEGNAI